MSAASERAEHDVDPAMTEELERLLGPRGSGVRHRTVDARRGGDAGGPLDGRGPVHSRSPELRADPEPELAASPEFASLFEALQHEVKAAESTATFRLKSQSTPRRRLLASAVFAALLATSVGLLPRPDLATYSLPLLVATVASLGALFAVVLLAALRPAYLPALPPGRLRAITGVAVLATCVLAVVPALANEGLHPHDHGFLFHAIPCLVFGLMGAVPVYGVVRLLDQGGGHVLAAVAAGLAANAILEVHCPYAGVAHRGLGHAAVLGLLLAGAFLLERRLTARR